MVVPVLEGGALVSCVQFVVVYFHRRSRCTLCGRNGCPVESREGRSQSSSCGPVEEGRMVCGWVLGYCSVPGTRCLDGAPAMCEWHGRFAGIVVRGRCSV